MKKICSFCSKPATKENSNDFYLSCARHKKLAQVETEKFFIEKPNYTGWSSKSKPKPKFDLLVTYYFYSNPNVGERYFKVKENKPVLQIISKNKIKKGRANVKGVCYIQYNTFIGSWGWKKLESRYIKTISKSKFDKVLNKMIKSFTK